ncbi:hypothetical protein L7F22_054220 [Adiantum nelumboides]|nr:hypothetical protein [Adiantum nelumboides]
MKFGFKRNFRRSGSGTCSNARQQVSETGEIVIRSDDRSPDGLQGRWNKHIKALGAIRNWKRKGNLETSTVEERTKNENEDSAQLERAEETDAITLERREQPHEDDERRFSETDKRSMDTSHFEEPRSLEEECEHFIAMQRYQSIPILWYLFILAIAFTSGTVLCVRGFGIQSFYQNKIQAYELLINERTQNLRRLEAQRNTLNARVRLLREELQLLQEPGSYVGEVVKVMGKKKVLVKVQPEGKYVVDFAQDIDVTSLTPSLRVALRSDSYTLHKILPNKIDPLVSLMMVEKVPDSTYEMVGGLDRQIKEIKEVIELPVKHPELFESLGIAQPKGVLLYGPPGTGKTLLARAVAHHTDCRFIRVSGSELVQKYIGEGSRMVRELFVMAREHAPSIIFMDEIDSIGSSRGESGSGGGDSEVQRTMLELLNQLDGFEGTKNIKVIMATNRIDILDSALLRPGRIDRKIEFPPPGPEARVSILRIHSRKMSLQRGINLRALAEKMGQCSEQRFAASAQRPACMRSERGGSTSARKTLSWPSARFSVASRWFHIGQQALHLILMSPFPFFSCV